MTGIQILGLTHFFCVIQKHDKQLSRFMWYTVETYRKRL